MARIVFETPELLGYEQNSSKSYNFPECKPRRSHNKSRNGCLTCKQSKVKCDEIRPICGLCNRKTRKCVYAPVAAGRGPGSVPHKPLEHISDISNSASDPVDVVEQARLLDHFSNFKGANWIGSLEVQNHLQEHGVEWTANAPYLLQAILSLSAYHLAFLNPAEKRYIAAASSHFDQAREAFTIAIESPQATSHADALVACSMILTIVSFHRLDPGDTLTVGDVNFARIRSVTLFKLLQDRPDLQARLDRGTWERVFACIRQSGTISPDVQDKYNKLYSLCHPNTCPAPHQLSILDYQLRNLPYKGPYVAVLASLLKALSRNPLDACAPGSIFDFTRDLDWRYLQLVSQKEGKALAILAHWYAALAQVDQWWVKGTARREGLRIVRQLEEVGNEDVKRLLASVKADLQ